ncbi:MAG: hypothetical protein LWW75_05625 [Chlorobiales bacterium]|nr:hypothetical protein [Chlorobiales bacterium]
MPDADGKKRQRHDTPAKNLQPYDDQFFRLWHYYLLSAAGPFRAGNVQLWQVLFSLNAIEGAYSTSR